MVLLFTSEDSTLKQFSIRYINERVHLLRDNHPIKDRLSKGEKRVYRSVEIPGDVNYASIHLVEISGVTRMIATHKNPMLEEVNIT